MLTRPQALALVLRRLALLGRELGKPLLEQANEETRLFGEAAALDSVGLLADHLIDVVEKSTPPA